MNRILAIAQNTLREAIRQKLLYGLIFFTILLIVASRFVGQLSIAAAGEKIVKDMGLATIFMMGIFISLSMGISLVFKEIDRKTIYTILAKPVSRLEFIVGKFVGLAFTVGVEILLMTLLLFATLKTYKAPMDWNIWKAVILIYMELCVLISITLVFSSYSSSFMTSLFCFSVLIIGHLTDDLAKVIGNKISYMHKKNITAPFREYTYGFLEKTFEFFSLDHFAINSKIVHGVHISWGYVGSTVLYGLCYVFIFLIIANHLFSKKDLK